METRIWNYKFLLSFHFSSDLYVCLWLKSWSYFKIFIRNKRCSDLSFYLNLLNVEAVKFKSSEHFHVCRKSLVRVCFLDATSPISTGKSSFRNEFRASSSSIHRKEVFERRVIGRIAEGRVFQAGIYARYHLLWKPLFDFKYPFPTSFT